MIREDEHGDKERRDVLSHARRDLVEQHLGNVLKGLSSSRKIERRPDPARAPMSFAQRRLWFMDRLHPGSATYNIPKVLRLRGTLDVPLLGRALNEIVRRHEALRTRFVASKDDAYQEIVPPFVLSLPVIDVIDGEPGNREAEAFRKAGEEARRPFDLTRGPLFRALLLRLGPGDHLLVLSMHHIISDGWSVSVLFRELSALYNAFAAGLPSPFAELQVQYADFAEWQRHSLTDEALAKQRSYWTSKLAGDLPSLLVPADRPRPTVQSFRGSCVEFVVPKETSQALLALGRREGATLFMVLAAAFDVLLHRLSGSTDIVFGTPIAGRTRMELEPLIGFFVNTLVFRTDLSGDPTFADLLKRVRAASLEAFSHQEFPFEKIVEELHPDRDPGRTPLFQVMFAVQSDASQALTLTGLEASTQDVNTDTAKFDMTISLTDTPQGLSCYWEYNADLFRPATVERISRQFRLILDGILADPEAKVRQLPLLLPGERRLITETWNTTTTEYPSDRNVAQVFEEQARLRPDAVALESDAARVTYAQLNARANVLAARLRPLVPGAGSVVGICMDRSIDMITGLIGILKAGCAYLPLDPDLPAERLAEMASDSGIETLLIQPHLRGRVPGFTGHEIVSGADGTESGEGPENPPHFAGPDDLVYIMYTSGSTGRPKGVEITHRGVLRLVKGANYVALGPDDVMLQYAPLSFDASTFEIWGCLLNGGKLVVVPAKKASVSELSDIVERSAITTLWLTAALFEQVMGESLERLKGVRQLLAGGDVLSAEHAGGFLRRYPDKVLINGYGPTENTTFTCCYPMKGVEEFIPSVPIGRPISNTEVYVLDDHLEPVPVGTWGELYIGGAGLARGYHRRPDLTAERFVPNPFRGSGARLYRSGDIVRYGEDGRIEFLGRRDNQVKLRGYRIELAEIESALRGQDGVREAVVAMREDRPGDKRLVGYCVPHPGATIDGRALRGFLKRKLPEYMVPWRIVVIERLPMTPSGKVDRRNLPPPLQDEPEAAEGPRTEAEEIVMNIWMEVLGTRAVGVEANFFDLGGHSLMATRVISRIQEATGVEIPLVDFFETPTVAALAIAIEDKLLSDLEKSGGMQPEGKNP